MSATGHAPDYLRKHKRRWPEIAAETVNVAGGHFGCRGNPLCLTEAGVRLWLDRCRRAGPDPLVEEVLRVWRKRMGPLGAAPDAAARIVAQLTDQAPAYVRQSLEYRIGGKDVRSLRYLADDRAYRRWREWKPRRSDPLPSDFVAWLEDREPDVLRDEQIRTWNDLNGLVQQLRCYGAEADDGPEVLRVVTEARRRGLLPPDEGSFRELS